MNSENQKIQERTLSFAIRIVKLCKFLDEQGGVGRVLANQLIRSGTSIGANVREAQSAQSDRDFLHKLEISLKEACFSSQLVVRSSQLALKISGSESWNPTPTPLTFNYELRTLNSELMRYWLIILVEAEVIKEEKVKALMEESTEIIKIIITITKKLQEKQLRTANSKLRTGGRK
jgi:four helix bundle protein